MTGEFLVIECTDSTGQCRGLQAVRVHERSVCKDRSIPCCVHNPSNHLMSNWPQHWRDDAGAMERVCPHGKTHPDPDHVAFMQYAKGYADVAHACDGCCGQ